MKRFTVWGVFSHFGGHPAREGLSFPRSTDSVGQFDTYDTVSANPVLPQIRKEGIIFDVLTMRRIRGPVDLRAPSTYPGRCAVGAQLGKGTNSDKTFYDYMAGASVINCWWADVNLLDCNMLSPNLA
jgi:hypothetical protein